MNMVGVAYWQWADGYMTNERSQPYEPSVTKVVNTVTGYPEISYFLSAYFMDNISSANSDLFKDVKLYDSTTGVDPNTPPTTNYEYLFMMQDTAGGDPAASSLFNITTLQTLCDLGANVTNIIADKSATWGVDFDLSKETGWVSLSDNLGLSLK